MRCGVMSSGDADTAHPQTTCGVSKTLDPGLESWLSYLPAGKTWDSLVIPERPREKIAISLPKGPGV